MACNTFVILWRDLERFLSAIRHVAQCGQHSPPWPSMERLPGAGIPPFDHRAFPLPTEHGPPRRVEQKMSAADRIHADPARSEDPQQVGVGHQHHGTSDRFGPFDHLVGPQPDVLDGFTACSQHPDPVIPDVPTRDLLSDLHGGPSVGGAVVPFDEIGVHSVDGQTGQPGGLLRPLQRADPHHRRLSDGERAGELPCLVFAASVERHVGSAGVQTFPCPIGFTVSDQEERGGGHEPAVWPNVDPAERLAG